MAILTELDALLGDTTLLSKLKGAVLVVADTVRQEAGATANHTKRMAWAQAVFDDPAAAAQRMLPAVIAANNAATVAQITGATDALIIAAVTNAVDVIAGV